MSKQERVQKPRTVVHKNTRTEVMDDTKTRSEERKQALEEEMNAMVDEIDDLLEENAELFVKSYVQKGGQLRAEGNTWFQPYGGACRTSGLRQRMASQER
jgi:prokaryotic ubiquitin-like protein Pup